MTPAQRDFNTASTASATPATGRSPAQAHESANGLRRQVDSIDWYSEVAALIRSLDLGPATCYGCSSGGQVALRIAAQAPDLVRRVIVHEVAPAAHAAGIEVGLLMCKHFPQVSIPEVLADHISRAARELST